MCFSDLVAYLGSQLCTGMAAAHDLRGQDGRPLGLVHRDMTPGNILVSFDGVVKIADFGIAKAEERITHTRTGTLKGKPAYMAPEQARGGRVDGRADLFSLGVMLYELLAGRRPWTTKGTFEVMMEIAEKEPPPLASLRPGVNPVFVRVVEGCLQKNPERRFGGAPEVQALLDEWRRGKGFESDDRQSLEGFVRRNAKRQIAWFDKALRGEMARADDAQTFKELEEHLDRARKLAPSGEVPALRPGAGAAAIDEARQALRSLTAKPPRPAAGRSSAAPPPPPPSRPRAPAPADFGRTMAVDADDIEVVGEANDLARTAYQPRFAEQPYAAVPAQALGHATAHGSTEMIPRPVITGTPVIAVGQSAPASSSDLDRTTFLERGDVPPAPPATGGDTVALDDRAAWSAFPLPASPPASQPSSASVPSSQAPSEGRPRGRGGLVLLVVLGLLLGAAVVGFFLRGPIVRALSPAAPAGP